MTITLILAPRIFRPSYGPVGILTALKIGNPNECLCNPDVKKNFVQENYQGRWNWSTLKSVNPNGCLCNLDVKKKFVQENYQGRRNLQFLTDQ